MMMIRHNLLGLIHYIGTNHSFLSFSCNTFIMPSISEFSKPVEELNTVNLKLKYQLEHLKKVR